MHIICSAMGSSRGVEVTGIFEQAGYKLRPVQKGDGCKVPIKIAGNISSALLPPPPSPAPSLARGVGVRGVWG